MSSSVFVRRGVITLLWIVGIAIGDGTRAIGQEVDEMQVALPTFPPIASPAMMGGLGPPFTAEYYQLISPSERKCGNDWPLTTYVEYHPTEPGKVTLPGRSMTAVELLKALSEQTGRRFAIQAGLQREAVVSANSEDWLPVLERFVDQTGLDLENVQDILVLSDPTTANASNHSSPASRIAMVVIVFLVAGGGLWYWMRPKKRIDPRGGW